MNVLLYNIPLHGVCLAFYTCTCTYVWAYVYTKLHKTTPHTKSTLHRLHTHTYPPLHYISHYTKNFTDILLHCTTLLSTISYTWHKHRQKCRRRHACTPSDGRFVRARARAHTHTHTCTHAYIHTQKHISTPTGIRPSRTTLQSRRCGISPRSSNQTP
jgi:hypothetical protein